MSKKDKSPKQKHKKSKKNNKVSPMSAGNIGHGLKAVLSDFMIYDAGSPLTKVFSTWSDLCQKSNEGNSINRTTDEFKVVVDSGQFGETQTETANLTLVSIGTAAEKLKLEIYSMVGFSNAPRLRGAVRYCVESLISPEQIFNALYSKTYRKRLIDDIIERAKGIIND